MDLQLRLRDVRRFFVGVIVVLVVAHLLLWAPDVPSAWWANLDGEDGLNNWYSGLLWAVGAAVAALVALQPGRARRGRATWLVLAGLFLLFSIDEEITAHEHLSVRVEQALNLDGAFKYGLPLIGLALVPLVIVGLVALWRCLPRRVATLLLIGAGLYVVAQVGLEEIESWATSHPWAGLYAEGFTWKFRLITPVQEATELAASSLMVYAALLQLAIERRRVRCTVVEAARVAQLEVVA